MRRGACYGITPVEEPEGDTARHGIMGSLSAHRVSIDINSHPDYVSIHVGDSRLRNIPRFIALMSCREICNDGSS